MNLFTTIKDIKMRNHLPMWSLQCRVKQASKQLFCSKKCYNGTVYKYNETRGNRRKVRKGFTEVFLFFFFFLKYLFIWLCQVLVAARGIFSL